MTERKVVKDIMLELFEYPHIPYWFSIEQVIKVIKASFFQSQKHTDPLVVLVFDEKYNLLGTVTPKDVLRGILSSNNNSAVISDFSLGQKTEIDWESLFNDSSKGFLQKPVSEVMVPAKHFVDPSDSIFKAAYLMINFDLPVLPVIEDKKKLLGVVRIFEIFEIISDEMIKK
ncbi:MAG: CBS domain-containing protein [Thermodesulfovibrio sp.]|nr:CBS domain-containing protein [Thermodesulfovibrio sp.]MDW7971816.1 CBS domain-containing protein [Thermodesulfovibrio sp.]